MGDEGDDAAGDGDGLFDVAGVCEMARDVLAKADGKSIDYPK